MRSALNSSGLFKLIALFLTRIHLDSRCIIPARISTRIDSRIRVEFLGLEKVNSTRTYDAEGFRKRAACLCFKDELKNEVLLVSSSAYPNLWVVPGGGLEPDEEPGRAAVRELLEEAGVKGRVMRYLGTFENQTRKHRTAVYILVVTEELEQWEDKQVMGRTRRWFPIEDAYAQLHDYKPFQEKYLREAVEAR